MKDYPIMPSSATWDQCVGEGIYRTDRPERKVPTLDPAQYLSEDAMHQLNSTLGIGTNRVLDDESIMRPETIVVIPSNRPERLEPWLKAWAKIWDMPRKPTVYIIMDAPKPFISSGILQTIYPLTFCFTHAEIDRDLGDNGVCIDRFSPGVRSYGIWKAAQQHPVMIWTTDDDCLPHDGSDPVVAHHDILFAERCLNKWFPLISEDMDGIQVLHRGHPYEERERKGTLPVLNHGLVTGMPDIDAVTQLHTGELDVEEKDATNHVFPGLYFPMSIQNVAFKTEIARLMYLPKLPDGMKRWSDIWCGLVMKKICDAHGLPVTSGAPCVHHSRASNVWANLKQEWAGYEVHERLWKVIDGVRLEGKDFGPDYLRIAEAIAGEFPELAVIAEGMRGWAKLWKC